MARKFLYGVAIVIMLALAGAFAYRMFGIHLLRKAMVPTVAFQPMAVIDAKTYADPKMWIARPDLPANPALWTPTGYAASAKPPAAVFFVHPTSFLGRTRWNAPLDDREANDRAVLFLRGQASAFNEVGAIWAPRYRQATFGAFLTTERNAQAALDLAYQDVSAAFTRFLEEVGPKRPIIIAGHSQGSLHLARLMKERIAGTPLANRIVAAYLVGWPVSKSVDLPMMGLPECRTAGQSNCILSWQSFAEPADPSLILDTFDASTGFTGASRAGTMLVCTNPLTGNAGDAAPDAANLGTLVPTPDMSDASIVTGSVPARCEGRGILMIGSPPDVGPYVLPGNNYHVFDYSLFWANIRADAGRRMAGFGK